MSRQKEIEESKDLIENLKSKHEELIRTRDLLVEDIEEVKESIRKVKDERQERKKVLSDQVMQIAPEVQFWEQILGLKIEGLKEDILQFVFTNIDEKDHSRPFSCVIDLSQAEYQMIKCAPELKPDVIDPIMKTLNDSLRLNLFLKQLRNAFKDTV